MKRSQRTLAVTLFVLAQVGLLRLHATENAGTADRAELPTGKAITPTAAKGSSLTYLDPELAFAKDVRAGQPGAIAISPDGKLMAVVTNGFNIFHGPAPSYLPISSSEFLVLFDISTGRPKQIQVIPISASFLGLVWSPDGDHLFVSGGTDDYVLEFKRDHQHLLQEQKFELRHLTSAGPTEGIGRGKPQVGDLAISPDGKYLLAANFDNDSVSLIDIEGGELIGDQDLRPGKIDPSKSGVAGGSYPRSLVWVSAQRAFVASQRDREIIELRVDGPKIQVSKRIPVPGAPIAMITNKARSRVFVALETSSQVAVLDSESGDILEHFDITAPKQVFDNAHHLDGALPNALALADGGKTLLVSNGGENAIAVVALSADAQGTASGANAQSEVVGLIPTGWFPTAIAVAGDGKTWYVANAKSPTGPAIPQCGKLNAQRMLCPPPPYKEGFSSGAGEGYDWFVRENQSINQVEKGSILTLPVPSKEELGRLTQVVAQNDRLDKAALSPSDQALFGFLREHIKHVIYIVKANESYDAVLGDLRPGNGDKRLAWYPAPVTPNAHALAKNFVNADNFYVSGGIGFTGLEWSMAGMTRDLTERGEPMAMADRGTGRGSGNNRRINMGLATSAERHAQSALSPADPDILPGTRDVYSIDGPDGAVDQGYLWDSVLNAGKTVRNYASYPSDLPLHEPSLVRDPHAAGIEVFSTTKPRLMPYTDNFFHYQWDFRYPDYWRVQEWKREYRDYIAKGDAPNLSLMWICQDVGEYREKSVDGGETPNSQVADNDYALGQIVQTVAEGPFAKDTVIIAIEDSSRNGADHVDAHRSTIFVAGPYIRHNAVVSTHYTTVSVVKTIEELLGTSPMGLNDMLAQPMSDFFDTNTANWTYKAVVPDALRLTKLPLPPAENGKTNEQ